MVDEHAIIGGGGIDVEGDNGTGNENVWPKEIRVNSRMVCRIIFGVCDGRQISYSLLVNMYLFRTEIRRTVLCTPCYSQDRYHIIITSLRSRSS